MKNKYVALGLSAALFLLVVAIGNKEILSLFNSAFNSATVINATDTFYRGINLNGPAVTIDGNLWAGKENASSYTYDDSPSFCDPNISGIVKCAVTPATDADHQRMLLSGLYNFSGSNVTLTNVASSTYKVYMYIWEDNGDTTSDFYVNGVKVQSAVRSGGPGNWTKLGPWSTDVTSGQIKVSAVTANGDAVILSGIEVWRVTPAVVSYTPQTPVGTFYRGVDLNGDGGSIDGNSWEGRYAANISTTGDSPLQNNISLANLIPYTDDVRANMIRNGVFKRTDGSGGTKVIVKGTLADGGLIPTAKYDVYLYVFEDNDRRDSDIYVNGLKANSTPVSVSPAGAWQRLGPYSTTVTNGAIEIKSTTSDADALIFSGVEIWKTGDVVISTPTTPVATTTTSTTTTTTPTPTTPPYATLQPQSGSFDRAFNLNGPAIVIDNNQWQSGALNIGTALTFPKNVKTFVAPSSLSLLSTSDANRLTMVKSGIYRATDASGGTSITVNAVNPAKYNVYLYILEDNKSLASTILVNNTTVATTPADVAGGTWSRLGPWPITVTGGTDNKVTIKSSTANGDTLVFSGIELWKTGDIVTSTPTTPIATTTVPVAPVATGDIRIKRVDANELLSASVPTDTKVHIDTSTTYLTTNPQTITSVALGNHVAVVSDISGFTESAGSCSYARGGTECSVTTFANPVTCSAGFCSTAANVNADIITKAVFKYVPIVAVPIVSAPTLTNPTVANITTTGATLGATITSLGGATSISARGICYGTALNPSLTSGAVCVQATLVQTLTSYTVQVTGLPSGATYHYRGYATNTTGTGYSTDGTFTTTATQTTGSLTSTGLAVEFEMAPVSGKNPSGVAVSNGQVTVEGDWQFGGAGSLHFRFNSAHNGADQGARTVTYTLPAPDGAYHKIEATYDLQSVTIKRDGVEVVKDWLDQQTTEIPTKSAPGLSFNTPIRNIKVTPFSVNLPSPKVEWQGVIGNSSVPQYGNGVWSAFLPAIAMTAYKDSMFVTWGYNEGKPLVGRFNVANPQKLEMFGFRIGAGQSSESPIDLSISGDTLYVKLANGKVVRFNATNNSLIGAERGESIAFPAPAARPVANSNDTWTFNDRTVGEPGGYVNGTDIKATRFGHWFIDGSRIARSAGAFQTDGKVWLSDTATTRLIRFNADGTPDGAVIHWTPHSYVMAVDKNDRSRAFNRFIEYRNGVPFRFYGNVMPSDAFGFGEGFTGVATVGGRTLALGLQRSGSSETKQLVELTPNGVVSITKGLPKESRLNPDGTVSDLNKIVKDGVTYSFAWGKTTGNHLTATKNGSTLWSALPTGDNTGNGTFDLRTEYPAQPGTFAVVGDYVIVATQMEFWRVGRFTGQGNQLFIFDKATGKFLRQFGLPMMMRGEVDNPPGTASNMFTIDAEQNADGTVTVWANDESNRGIVVWKIY